MLPVEALVQLYLSLRQVSQPLHLLPLYLVQLGSDPVTEELELLGYCSITDFINLELIEFFSKNMFLTVGLTKLLNRYKQLGNLCVFIVVIKQILLPVAKHSLRILHGVMLIKTKKLYFSHNQIDYQVQ